MDNLNIFLKEIIPVIYAIIVALAAMAIDAIYSMIMINLQGKKYHQVEASNEEITQTLVNIKKMIEQNDSRAREVVIALERQLNDEKYKLIIEFILQMHERAHLSASSKAPVSQEERRASSEDIRAGK